VGPSVVLHRSGKEKTTCFHRRLNPGPPSRLRVAVPVIKAHACPVQRSAARCHIRRPSSATTKVTVWRLAPDGTVQTGEYTMMSVFTFQIGISYSGNGINVARDVELREPIVSPCDWLVVMLSG